MTPIYTQIISHGLDAKLIIANSAHTIPIIEISPPPSQKDAAFLLTVGSFLLTVELFYLQLTILAFLLTVGALLLTILAFLLTVGAFLLTVGKCV